VILVIIIAMAWMVILGPGLIKRRLRTGEIGSISHFHKQLRVLELSSSEPIVAPAYRLRSVEGSTGLTAGSERPGAPAPAPVLSVVGASQRPRPALAFLAEGPGAPRTGGERFRSPGPMDLRDPMGTGGPMATGGAVDAAGAKDRMALGDARYRVRKRRRDTLGVMAALFVGTLLIGFVPGAAPAWIVTALSGLALGAYVALLVHLRRGAEERDRKLHYLRPQGVGASVSLGGRYAHPSYQAIAH
jgi:hypothetical protein